MCLDWLHRGTQGVPIIEQETEPLIELIASGESGTLEFKPAIFWDFTNEREADGYLCLIPICAFLNSRGGQLIIGVNDDKSVGGLTPDLALMKAKSDPRDEFQLRLRGLIERYLPPFVFSALQGNFLSHRDKTIFILEVRPSAEPVFLRRQVRDPEDYIRFPIYARKRFFIRCFSSNKELDMEGVLGYVKGRWPAT